MQRILHGEGKNREEEKKDVEDEKLLKSLQTMTFLHLMIVVMMRMKKMIVAVKTMKMTMTTMLFPLQLLILQLI